mgnify:CR=1 FL=1
MAIAEKEKNLRASVQSREAVGLNTLRKKARVKETIIQAFLFICGAISILTTIGIVYELGKESLLFFSRRQWELTNKPVVEDIEASWTTFEVGSSGSPISVGDLIRLENEIMRVEAVGSDRITVERGVDGTEVTPHPEGREIEVAETVTHPAAQKRLSGSFDDFVYPQLNHLRLTLNIIERYGIPG